MELGTDEAYYWFYSQNLKLNYFDHPPMIAFIIRLFTGNLLLQSHEVFVRLGSVAGCAISSWFIYKTCTFLHSARAGLLGVCLYNISFFAAVTAGIFIMPDAPLMVFFTLCLHLIAQLTQKGDDWLLWISFGIAAGLCVMSKIYGLLPWAGLGMYLLIQQRSWLKKPQLYVALLISIVITMPILLWNINYGFATHDFQADRLSPEDSPINPLSFLREFFNQFLYNNPFNVVITAAALIWYLKNSAARLPALTIFNYIGLPLAVLLLVIALKRDSTLPHWSGPTYVALIPVAAIYLASVKSNFPAMLWAGIAGFIVFLIVWQAFIQFRITAGGNIQTLAEVGETHSGSGKLLAAFNGFAQMQLIAEPVGSWSKAEERFVEIYTNDISKGSMRVNSPVVCNKWWGAQVEYYFCYKSNIPVIGMGTLNELHEYMWTNAQRIQSADMSTAYCIIPADISYDAKKYYSKYYSKIGSRAVINITGKYGLPLRFYVYRLTGWKGLLPIIKQ
jgi:4-amino-4-deoxy-L-arabinose transferase-like glycosyltransferase